MSKLVDYNAELSVLELQAAVSKTSTFNGTGVDLLGYQGKIKVTQDVGAVTGTTPTLDGKIQDSADNSTFADVTGLTFTQVTTSSNIQSIGVDPRAVRRYIRYVGTLGGTTPNFTFAVLGLGQKNII